MQRDFEPGHIETIFTKSGAELEHSGSGKLQVKLNGHVANCYFASTRNVTIRFKTSD